MSAIRSPAAAALEAFATYLDGVLATLDTPPSAVLRGWPETDQGMDLDTGPVVSITQTGRAEETPVHPSVLGTNATSYNVRTALLTVPMQLDVWARSREALDIVTSAVDDALHNDLPYRPYLYLVATDHQNRPFCVRREGDAPDIDGDTAPTGEWRAIYTLSVEIDRVVGVELSESVSVSATVSVTAP